ncbi:hypothetical protein C1708_06205 [Streptomyces sp. DH-12]|nr:hypothetical protein C1708_06205 [Streptomyces sp. DH-12]
MWGPTHAGDQLGLEVTVRGKLEPLRTKMAELANRGGTGPRRTQPDSPRRRRPRPTRYDRCPSDRSCRARRSWGRPRLHSVPLQQDPPGGCTSSDLRAGKCCA